MTTLVFGLFALTLAARNVAYRVLLWIFLKNLLPGHFLIHRLPATLLARSIQSLSAAANAANRLTPRHRWRQMAA